MNYICLYQDRKPYICDLHNEMPINPITDASVRVYEEEIEMVFRWPRNGQDRDPDTKTI